MGRKFIIQIEDRAKIEIADAYDWYEEQNEGLGESFLKAFQKALIAIQKSPNGYREVYYHRQFPMKHFPFVILYEINIETIYVDAVFHTSRDPKQKLI